MSTENVFEQVEQTKKSNNLALMITFADLMSILMSFFILLYSLSEVDKEKFKLLGQSLQLAFGSPLVQINKNNDYNNNYKEILEATINKNFENQTFFTANYNILINKNLLENIKNQKTTFVDEPKNNSSKNYSHTEKDSKILRYLMAPEIDKNFMHIQQEQSGILISLSTQKAFKSGSSEFTPEMKEAIEKLSKYMNGLPGKITIKGHTDNIPISNSKYRSNWELSAGRAYTVIHTMVEEYHLEKERFHLEAYADTANIAPNDTEENRSQNRRIEIYIDQSSFYDN